MKNNISLLVAFILIALTITVLMKPKTIEAQTVQHFLPWGTGMTYIKSSNYPTGSAQSDSGVVIGPGGWLMRIAPRPGVSYNSSSVGLSKSQLNTQYPNQPVGHIVVVPGIALGGAVYIKAIESGTNDTWQTISAPPTL
jgi:hypothetical protein